MTTWLWIVLVVIVVVMVLLRITPLMRVLRRLAWHLLQIEERWTLQPPQSRFAHLIRTLLIGASRLIRAVLLAGASLHVRIDDLSGKITGVDADGRKTTIDGPTVTEVIRVGMLRTGATGGSTPLFVAAPFGAATAFSAVAEAVSDVSERGKLAAAAMRLLSLIARILGRDELVLSGRLVSSSSRGPGLALLLSHASGRTLDSRTVWADTYETGQGNRSHSSGDPTDRLLRVAVAAAVWTQFALLRAYGALTPEDLRWRIGTAEWESYAFHQVAALLKPEHSRDDPGARCLFAHALDRDPHNFDARFNLDSECVSTDASLKDALEDLKALRGEVKAAKETRAQRQWLRPRHTHEIELRDPFRFQIAIRRSVLAMERWQRDLSPPNGDPSKHKILLDDLKETWRELTEDLLLLEKALLKVDDISEPRASWGRNWASSLTIDSSDDTVRIVGFLQELEGRMLAAWASIAVHLERHREGRSRHAHSDACESPTQAIDRGRLIFLLEQCGDHPPMHETVVERYLLPGKSLLNETTRYNLSCYFADRDLEEKALAQLRQALGTRHRCKRALEDVQLAKYKSEIERICSDLAPEADGQKTHPILATLIF